MDNIVNKYWDVKKETFPSISVYDLLKYTLYI